MYWLLAVHIIFMVTWFSGLFYLPRLFVYHAMSKDLSMQARFKIMERRLYYYITIPGGILTIISGFWLLFEYFPNYQHVMWMHIKLISVGILVIYHLYCGKLLHDFTQDSNQHSPVFYRWFNEIPTLILIIIVLMVIVKPAFG